MTVIWTGLILAGIVVAWLGWREIRQRGLDHCLAPYVLTASKRRPVSPKESVHMLLCLADHFEPYFEHPPREVASSRVERWVREYPRLFGRFRDSDGRPPRHTFFYPIDMYEPAHVDALAELCRAGFAEMEVHYHHDGDNSENLRERLLEFKELLAKRHNLLSRHRKTGNLAYGFIHGDWALDNSRPDGRCCGVNNELDVLRETGCYADFTMPSAPDCTQTRKINSIYYAVDDPLSPKSHDTGIDVGRDPAPQHSLMLIQGPLVLNWHCRKWGLLPRVENGSLQANFPPTIDRLKLWLQARVQIPTRPDWFFVKLHCHGAPEQQQKALLGDSMIHFHESLAHFAEKNRYFHFHYVTAREMYNLVRAAEMGWKGSIVEAIDFELLWNGQDPHRTPTEADVESFSRPWKQPLVVNKD
jgi:hypothetical protein